MAEPQRGYGRRQVLRGLLLGAAGLAVPAACGVPSGGPPVVDGPGPSSGDGTQIGGGTPPGPETATSPEDLVDKYLAAAAGPLDPKGHEQIQDRVAKFLSTKARQNLQVGQKITLVRPGTRYPTSHDPNDQSDLVSLDLKPVGQLTQQGSVEPSVGQWTKCEFRVRTTAPGRYLIDQVTVPPELSGILLSTEVLGNLAYFTPVSVYFAQRGDIRAVVPDLRYVAQTGGNKLLYTTIINYLLNGPTDWLEPAVAPLPGDLSFNGLVVTSTTNGTLVVPLKGLPQQADVVPVTALMAQLRWSLASSSPAYTGPLQLQSNNQPLLTSNDSYQEWNLAEQRAPSTAAERYCVFGGRVRPLSDDVATPQVLNSDNNTQVVSAALSRDKHLAALVRQSPSGRHELWIGQLVAGTAMYKKAALTGAQMSRPVWLPGREQLLVLADGILYAVGLDGVPQSVWPGPNFKAFAVSPEGGRIVLVTARGPVLTSLVYNAGVTGLGASSLSALPPFDCGGLDPRSLTAVAWSRMDRVVLGGRRDTNYSLAEVSVDGALTDKDDRFSKLLLTSPFTLIVGYPPLPSEGQNGFGRIMCQAGSGPGPYVIEYVGSTQESLPTPKAPSPSASDQQPKPTLSAPFFLD